MAAEARYLEERKSEWDYYHYHDAKWEQIIEEIDEELFYFTDSMNHWKSWSDGFLIFYKEIIANEVTRKGISKSRFHSTKESFRNMHELERGDNIQKYTYEAEKLILSMQEHTQLGENEVVEWKKWFLTGWFPHINFENMSDEEKSNYQSYALRMILGAFYYATTSVKSHEQQMRKIVEVSVLMDALEIPGWIFPEIAKRISGLKNCLNELFANIEDENRPLFKMNLSWDKRGMGSNQELIYQNLHSALNREDVLQVYKLGVRLEDMQAKLPGWASQLLTISYALNPKWMTKLITPERNPFVFNSICLSPLYQHDLKLLLELAKEAGVWGKIEITKHILTLYNDRNNKLSHKLLLLLYVKECFGLLIQMNRPDVLILLVNQLIPWRNDRGHGNMKWLGSCLGEALRENANPSLIQQMFAIWNPPIIQTHKLEVFLVAVRYAFQREMYQDLLAKWEKGIINLWFKRLIPIYLVKNRNSNHVITHLENAIIPILVERYSKKGNLLRIIEKLIERWNRVEAEWFLSENQEQTRKNGILAALIVAIFVAANLESNLLGNQFCVKSVCEKVHHITEDRRNWEVDESQNLQAPFMLDEINKAVRVILSKV